MNKSVYRWINEWKRKGKENPENCRIMKRNEISEKKLK